MSAESEPVRMRMTNRWFSLALPLIAAVSAPVQAPPLSIVPWPADVRMLTGEFTLDADTRIVVLDPSNVELRRLAAYLLLPIRGRPGVNYRIPAVSGLEVDRLTLDATAVVMLSHPVSSAEIRFTVDGSEPTSDSNLYDNPFVLWFDPAEEQLSGDASATVSARAFMPGGRPGPTSRARFSRTRLLESRDTGLKQRQLFYRYYEHRFGSARDVLRAGAVQPEIIAAIAEPGESLVPDAIPPTQTGYSSRIGLNVMQREDDFGSVFEGYMRAPSDGIYTFYVSSDDGAVLVVGDRVVVDHDGLHGMTEKSGSIALEAGFHPIAVGFFQAGGAKGLEISVSKDGGERSELPPEWLHRRE